MQAESLYYHQALQQVQIIQFNRTTSYKRMHYNSWQQNRLRYGKERRNNFWLSSKLEKRNAHIEPSFMWKALTTLVQPFVMIARPSFTIFRKTSRSSWFFRSTLPLLLRLGSHSLRGNHWWTALKTTKIKIGEVQNLWWKLIYVQCEWENQSY